MVKLHLMWTHVERIVLLTARWKETLSTFAGFLFSKRPTDLKDALKVADTKALKKSDLTGVKDHSTLVSHIETSMATIDRTKGFGAGAVARGQGRSYKMQCAECHSTQTDGIDFKNTAIDFHKREADPRVKRLEQELARTQGDKTYLSELLKTVKDDTIRTGLVRKMTSVHRFTKVGTYACRALHANHAKGQVYQPYGSDTLRNQEPITIDGVKVDDGKGYYRNFSLLSLWAHAPFMHNNSVGPEICGEPEKYTGDFW